MQDGAVAALPAFLAANGPFDFAFSYSVGGEWRAPNGKSIGELIDAPHVIQYVDHPFTHYAKLSKTPASAIILTIDESHAELIRSAMGKDRFAQVAFNPHAAIGTPAPLPDDAADYAAARPIRMLFAGTFYKPGETPWSHIPQNVQVIFNDAADRALSQDWLAPHHALLEALFDRHIGPEDEITKQLMPYTYAIHEWVRLNRRFDFLKAAIKARLPLTVVGSGYEKDLYRFKKMDYRGPAGFNDVLGLIRQSRMVVNVNVNFGQGSHERPLCAMLGGAVAASEASTFYSQNFNVSDLDGEMSTFRWSSLDYDLEGLIDLAESPERLLGMARAAQQTTLKTHMWINRARNVIAIVEQVAGQRTLQQA